MKKRGILKVKFGLDPNSSGPGGPAQLIVYLFLVPLFYLIISAITPPLLLLISLYKRRGEKIKALAIAVGIGVILLLGNILLTYISSSWWSPYYGARYSFPYPSFEYTIWNIWMPIFKIIFIPYIIASTISFFILRMQKNLNWKLPWVIYLSLFIPFWLLV